MLTRDAAALVRFGALACVDALVNSLREAVRLSCSILISRARDRFFTLVFVLRSIWFWPQRLRRSCTRLKKTTTRCIVDALPPHYISASDTFAFRPLKHSRRELSRIWRPCSGKACRITPHEEGSLAYLPSKHIVAQRTRATRRNARSSSKLDFSMRITQAAQRRIRAARGGDVNVTYV